MFCESPLVIRLSAAAKMASASELAAEWSSTAAAVGIGSDYDSSHVMRVLLEATSGAQVLLQMVCHGVRRDRPKGVCAVVSHNKCSFFFRFARRKNIARNF